jgi:hypothetical protein
MRGQRQNFGQNNNTRAYRLFLRLRLRYGVRRVPTGIRVRAAPAVEERETDQQHEYYTRNSPAVVVLLTRLTLSVPLRGVSFGDAMLRSIAVWNTTSAGRGCS